MQFVLFAALVALSALCLGCASTPSRMSDDPNVPRVTPFLMFQDERAEEALRFYVATFPDSSMGSIEHHTAESGGTPGSLLRGHAQVRGQRIMAFDSPPVHEFGFTPSVSMFVECVSDEELDRLYQALSVGGSTMMPPNNYGFSQRFTWVQDKFGVSWQLNHQGDS